MEAALSDIGHPEAEGRREPATLVRELGAELIELRPLKDKVTELERKIEEMTPQAADGAQYRADLRAAVEREYVRARGEKANVAAKAELWDRCSIAALKQELEEYGGEAATLFTGGRMTVDDEPEPKPQGRREYPAAAYAV
jgi:hypothetical protein